MTRRGLAISSGWDSALTASPARSRDGTSSLEGADDEVLGLVAKAFAGRLSEVPYENIRMRGPPRPSPDVAGTLAASTPSLAPVLRPLRSTISSV